MVLDKSNIGNTFCPTAVSISPTGVYGEYDILSDCYHVFKNIYRMKNTAAYSKEFQVLGIIPMNDDIKTTGFCSLGNEMVIQHEKGVFSKSGEDSFNHWTAPLKSLEDSSKVQLFCFPKLERVAYIAKDRTGMGNSLIVQDAVTGLLDQGKRFPILIDNLGQGDIKLFNAMGVLTAVTHNTTKYGFTQIIDNPRFFLMAGDVQKRTEVVITITIRNKQAKQVFTQLVTVNPKK